MNNQQVSQIVFMVFAGFPQSEGHQTEERLRIYKEMLIDLDFDAARAAVARLLQTSRFFPKIAEIREAARGVTGGLRRTGLEAWGDVTRAIRLVGSYRAPKFKDPIVAQVVTSLGWLELCLGENESALRARFIEAYDSMSEREYRELAVSPQLRLQAAQGGVAAIGSGEHEPPTIAESKRPALRAVQPVQRPAPVQPSYGSNPFAKHGVR